VVCGQRHAAAALSPEKSSGPIVQEAGWASESVCMDAENLARTEVRSPDSPVCGESLQLLRHPGPQSLYACMYFVCMNLCMYASMYMYIYMYVYICTYVLRIMCMYVGIYIYI